MTKRPGQDLVSNPPKKKKTALKDVLVLIKPLFQEVMEPQLSPIWAGDPYEHVDDEERTDYDYYQYIITHNLRFMVVHKQPLAMEVYLNDHGWQSYRYIQPQTKALWWDSWTIKYFEHWKVCQWVFQTVFQ